MKLAMTALLDHTMIRIEDLEETLDWYRNHFGWEEKDRWEADTFTNVYIGPEDMHDEGAMLELTYNHGDHSYDFGDAWGHIALRVDDLYEAYDGLMDEGVEDYRDPDSCGGEYAFVRGPDGHEIELLERDHGAEWSIDHTMIRVEDVYQAIGWYTRVLDYTLVERREFDSFALYFMQPAEAAPEAMSVELTYNYDGRSYKQGDAWGHMCIRSEDLAGDWETYIERGAADYRDPASCDNLFAFTKDANGFEIEILDRDPNTDSLFPA
jgi:lactoylglutathione lyase